MSCLPQPLVVQFVPKYNPMRLYVEVSAFISQIVNLHCWSHLCSMEIKCHPYNSRMEICPSPLGYREGNQNRDPGDVKEFLSHLTPLIRILSVKATGGGDQEATF